MLGIAAERKMRRDRRLNQIAKILEKQGRGLLGSVLGGSMTRQRLPGRKSRPMWNRAASREHPRHFRRLPLEIGDDGIDGIEYGRPISDHAPSLQRQRLSPRFEFREHAGQTVPAEEPQDHFNSEIRLLTADAS